MIGVSSVILAPVATLRVACLWRRRRLRQWLVGVSLLDYYFRSVVLYLFSTFATFSWQQCLQSLKCACSPLRMHVLDVVTYRGPTSVGLVRHIGAGVRVLSPSALSPMMMSPMMMSIFYDAAGGRAGVIVS